MPSKSLHCTLSCLQIHTHNPPCLLGSVDINHPLNELWAIAISLCPPRGYNSSMKALASLSSLNGVFMKTLYLHL